MSFRKLVTTNYSGQMISIFSVNVMSFKTKYIPNIYIHGKWSVLKHNITIRQHLSTGREKGAESLRM